MNSRQINPWTDIDNAWDYFPKITNGLKQQFRDKFQKVMRVMSCNSQESFIMVALIYQSSAQKNQAILKQLRMELQAFSQYKSREFPLVYQKYLSSFNAIDRGLNDALVNISNPEPEIIINYFSDARCQTVLGELYSFLTKMCYTSSRIQELCKLYSVRLNMFQVMNNDKIELINGSNLKVVLTLDLLVYEQRFFLVKQKPSANQQGSNVNSPANYSSVNSPAVRTPTISKTPLTQIGNSSQKQPSSFSTEAQRQYQRQQQMIAEEQQAKQLRIIGNSNGDPQNRGINQQGYMQQQGMQPGVNYQNQPNNQSPVKMQNQSQNYGNTAGERFQSIKAPFCSLCGQYPKTPQDIYVNRSCGHGICRNCIPRMKYPNAESMDCYRKGCYYKVSIHDMESFHDQNVMKEMSKSVVSFTIDCSYCSKKTEITLDRKPEYYKCQSCNGVSCLLHSKPSKLDNCFCICSKCLSETKQNGKMRCCEKCKITKCIRCKQQWNQISNTQCDCGCLICGRALKAYSAEHFEECDCSKSSICSICLIPLEINTLSIPNSQCIHTNCHPCFVQTQSAFGAIKCVLCQLS